MLVAAVCVAAVSANSASAAIVFLRSGDKVAGYLVSQDLTQVHLRVPVGEGKLEDRIIPRSDVKYLKVTVEKDRLAALNHKSPEGYIRYAEELAPVAPKDPEARDVAMRLFAIAAHLDPQRLGRGSLLGMANMARTPAEAKKFHALAYVLDPGHDAQILTSPAPPPANANASPPPSQPAAAESRDMKLLLLRLKNLRYGNTREKALRPV